MTDTATVKLETGLPAELTPEQQQEILNSIVEFRKQKKTSKRLVLHGWKLEWNVSKARGVERGDLTVYDPHTGGKICSLLALKRRFGLEPELPPPEPAAVEYEDAVTAEYEETKRKRALLDQAPELLERSKRSTRKEVSYVEMTSVAPPRSALVTLALKNKGGAGSDLDYVEICRAVHRLGDAVEPAVPFTAVRTAMLSMLRNGSLRRALADTARVPPNPPIEHALSMLVLSTLQVDEPSDTMESLASLSHLKERLPISSLDPSAFSCPVGWVEERDDSGRRRKKKWVQYEGAPSDGRVLREFERRQELEATLEAEAESAAETGAAAGTELVSPPYLGNLVNGLEGPEWQISPHAAGRALRYILGRLVDRGLVAPVTADEARGTRNTQPQWAVRNRYYRAEQWPRLKRERLGKEVEEEPEEELADIEIERKRNIARNQEILRQLGLA